MTVREQVDGLLRLIESSRDETNRLERKLRSVRQACHHVSLEKSVVEDLFIDRKQVSTTITCTECGGMVKRTTEVG